MTNNQMEHHFTADQEGKILSTLIELLKEEKLSLADNQETISIIRDAVARGECKFSATYHLSIVLIVLLQMDDFIRRKDHLQLYESLIDSQLRTLFPGFKQHRAHIRLIPRDIGEHKVNYSEKYFEEQVTSIVSFIDSDNFKQHPERMLKLLSEEDYPAAIAEARDTLDSFMKHVIDENEKNFGNLTKKFIEKLLLKHSEINGEHAAIKVDINNILQSITNARNVYGGHGADRNRVAPKKYEARLIVENAITIMRYSQGLLEEDPLQL